MRHWLNKVTAWESLIHAYWAIFTMPLTPVQPSVAAPFRHDLYNDRHLFPLTHNGTHILDLTKRDGNLWQSGHQRRIDPPEAICGTLEPIKILMSKWRLPTSVNDYSRPYLQLNPIDWASLSFLEHQKAWQHHVRYAILPGNISTNLEGKKSVSVLVMLMDFIMILRCLGRKVFKFVYKGLSLLIHGVWEVRGLDLHWWHVSLHTWSDEWLYREDSKSNIWSYSQECYCEDNFETGS